MTDTETQAVIPPATENKTPWYEYIDRKRRHNFLAILEELSRRQDKHAPEFVLIGALPLLMRNYLHYLAWWDIDLLFCDVESLRTFAENTAAPHLQIKPTDDEIVSTADLVCLHTLWSFGHTWANVDCIYRPQRFQFFYETIRDQAPFIQTVRVDNREYHLSLLLGNPWDIFVDKLILSRLVEQLQAKDFLGKDLRHIVSILQRHLTEPGFWKHLVKKSEALGRKDLLKAMLFRLLEIAPELGYMGLCDPQEVVRYFGKS